MVNEVLPIGSVVKNKNGKLCVIVGYYGYNESKIINYSTDYIVTAFPFDYSNLDYGEKILTKNKWYSNFPCSMNNSDIEELLFEGYKNEQFYELKNKIMENR